MGAELRPFPFLETDLTLFYKDLNGLPSATEAVEVVEGVARERILDNRGQGEVMGLELMIRLARVEGFEGWLSYTLSQAERTDGGAEEPRPFDFDQPHILTLVARYELLPTWTAGVRWRYVSGRPTTPLLGGIFREDRDAYEPISGPNNSSRIEDFHQLDVRLDKSWAFEGWSLETYLSVTNAYNRANAEDIRHRFDYAESEKVKGLPVLAILGAEATF
ncbi:MAG: TonB-dependent receptor [Deltaproteobacteria bacterium]|nr:TonB-dependent receptor [Deltaproteobacteria bacterium]